ncbi:MAG: dTMP kinase [Clostridia bacterium]
MKKFIVFEGIDGCGKTTQIQMYKDYLEKKGLDVLLTREPGGVVLAEKIRDILLDKRSHMGYMTEALLYAAARAEHVEQIIEPALKAGKVVLCDRFIYSSVVYQGYARQLGVDKILMLNKIATKDLNPDVYIFIDIPLELCLQRRQLRIKEGGQAQDRIESESQKFQEKVYEGYHMFMEIVPNIVSISGLGKPIEVHKRLIHKIDPIVFGI